MAKLKPPSDLTQFLEQLREQPPERLRELLQGSRLTDPLLRGPQLPPHVAAEWKLRGAEQEQCRWQEQVEEALGPSWRDDPDMAQADQHWAEHLAQLRATLTYLRGVLKKPQASKPKKHAGGQSPKLTNEEILRLRAAYDTAQAKEKRKQSIVFKEIKKLLPKHKQTIKDRTLRHYLITLRSKVVESRS